MSAAKTGQSRAASARRRDRAAGAGKSDGAPRGAPTRAPENPRRARMLAALELATERMNAAAAGPVAWGAGDRTVGRLTDRADGGRAWLRLQASPVAEAGGEQWQGNKTAEFAFGALRGHRPRLLGLLDWTDPEPPTADEPDAVAYRAELTEYVGDLVCSPTPVLHEPLDLPDAWWDGLHAGLDTVAEARTQRFAVRQDVVDRIVPEHLGVPAPTLRTMVPAHGDLHWANITRETPYLMDWERWGRAPLGYDAATLHAHSLRTPDVAARIRAEFPVLDSPDGRIAEIVVTAELLHAVDHGDNLDLADALRAQARRLTTPVKRAVRVRLPQPSRPMTTVADRRL
ncbi:MAG TPA: hypothetical protein VLH10_04025 [Yinghuangia sp.]|uniref:hypothetical protein n=1 Tax=Yinghuangia sp. YIM S10712 TaxID=3436930 RepID=UPI002B729FA2|nr:hypothetical protein [Yinghuangia sp.]